MEHEPDRGVYHDDLIRIMLLLADILAGLRGMRDELKDNGEEEEGF
jgi:hypothetical protein